MTYRLVVEPVDHIFVNSDTLIRVKLVDSQDQLQPSLHVPFKVSLYRSNHMVDCIVCNPPFPAINSNSATSEVHIRITQLSMHNGNEPFILIVVPLPKNGITLQSGTSNPFYVVRHKLLIEQQPETKWYKDSGGKSKNHLKVDVKLVDHHGDLVTGRSIPIYVTLIYSPADLSTNLSIPDQSILNILNEDKLMLDETGLLKLRFRIEDVSKNHQNHAFCFRISPHIEISPTSADVSQVVSGPVHVFSKTASKKRNTESFDERPQKVRATQPDEEVRNPLHLNSLLEEGKSSQALSEWCDLVIDILKDVRAKLVYKDTQTCFYRCSGCSVYSNTQEFQHSENCSVTSPTFPPLPFNLYLKIERVLSEYNSEPLHSSFKKLFPDCIPRSLPKYPHPNQLTSTINLQPLNEPLLYRQSSGGYRGIFELPLNELYPRFDLGNI